VWRARALPDAWPVAVPAVAFLVANLVDWPWHIAGIGAVWAVAIGSLLALGRADSRSVGYRGAPTGAGAP
jgi:hypothetical protein